MKQKSSLLVIKQLLYNPKSKDSKEIGYFEEVFPWNSDENTPVGFLAILFTKVPGK